jgi:2-polyprenyl-6-methoxyphenol hydroxylase-like FAD-dependent oxidoreductase
MTLSTIPGYDAARLPKRGGHAVVVGAGMAGLFAARVLADAFESVTVLDSDTFPDEPTARRGVPQGPHPHALLEAGRATMADLLPGAVEDVVAGGGVVTDFARGVDFYNEGDFLAEGPVPMETVSATRPLFEHAVRRHVAAHDSVSFRTNCLCTEYCLDDAGTTVEGVVIRSNSGPEEVPADLVVDASGRTSRTPAWLETHGYAPPPVDEVTIDVAYSTAFLERPPGDTRTYLVPPSAPRTRGGMAAPVEGNRWIVNLSGVHGETPPTDHGDFADYAARLPVPELARLVDDHEWAAEDVHPYRFPSNRRHRYAALDRFPDDLLVVGDAVASFNPVYAQGMSVAALEALVLHHVLADDPADLPGRFFARTASVVDIAWSLAVGADFGFPETRGQKPWGTAFFNWYLGRLLRHAHSDGRLTDAFVRVLTMERPPTSLLRPTIAWRVLRPTR